jgi:hypothetical protein
MPCDDCSRADDCPPCVNEHVDHDCYRLNCNGEADESHKTLGRLAEQMGSASSSPDEECVTCGHWRDSHDRGDSHCRVCHTKKVAGDVSEEPFCLHDFTPRRPTEPESRYCGEGGVCRDPLRRCGLKCRRAFPPCRAQFHGGSEGFRCQSHEGHNDPHAAKIPNGGTFNWDDSVAVYPAEPDAAQEAAMQELTDLRQEMEADEPEARDCWACKHAEHRAFSCTEQRDGDDCSCGAHTPEPEAPECPPACAEAHTYSGDCLLRATFVHGPEPEEPGPTELAPCPICGDRRKTNEFMAGLLLCEPCIYADGQPFCFGCGSKEAPFGLVSHEGEDKFNELRCSKCLLPPRRPPYAVAYAVAGGAQYEIALPGDATVRFADGALIITHASAVLALTQARPMEGA